MAEAAARDARAAARLAAQQRALQQERANAESHETYLPNVTSMPVDIAKKVVGIVEVMIERKEDVGTNIHAANGELRTSSLQTYLSWLRDYISAGGASTEPASPSPPTPPGNLESASNAPSTRAPPTPDPIGASGQNHVYLPNVSSLTAATAASVYNQVKETAAKHGFEDAVLHARSGETQTQSIETYLSWLAAKAGLATSA